MVRGSSQEAPSSFGWVPLPQVIDGFFVKRTADIKESAAYLALLTQGLQRLYQVSRRTCPWALCSPRGSEVSKSPVFQAGPRRPRIRQGLAGGWSPRALSWPQFPLPSGPYPPQSPLGTLRGP